MKFYSHYFLSFILFSSTNMYPAAAQSALLAQAIAKDIEDTINKHGMSLTIDYNGKQKPIVFNRHSDLVEDILNRALQTFDIKASKDRHYALMVPLTGTSCISYNLLNTSLTESVSQISGLDNNLILTLLIHLKPNVFRNPKSSIK